MLFLGILMRLPCAGIVVNHVFHKVGKSSCIYRELMNKRGYFICKEHYAIGWVNLAQRYRVLGLTSLLYEPNNTEEPCAGKPHAGRSVRGAVG